MPRRCLNACFAALLPLCALDAAHAQSSVTMYGIADMYGEYVRSDNASISRLQSGGLSGSRLGFKGIEDLGGGLSADFTLEMGINLDDGSLGQGGLAFGRVATVGIKDQRLGHITLGRQYSSLYVITDEFSEFSNSSDGASTSVIGGFGGYEPVRGANDSASGAGGPARLNNSVAYATPSWGGFRFGVTGAFGEIVDDTGGNRVWDTYARFTQGGFDAMLSLNDDQGGVVTPDAHRRTWTGAAKYALGNWGVMGGYLYTEDRSGADQNGSGAWIGMDYLFGASRVLLQYAENNPRYLDDAKTQALGLGYQYSFSKRLTLYSSLTYFKNQDGIANATGRASFSVPAGMGGNGDNDYTEVVGGMRFRF